MEAFRKQNCDLFSPDDETSMSGSNDQATAPVEAKTSKRLVSLDVFRGLTIFGMLLVNNIALGDYTPAVLTHAPWRGGITFADLVFPWFLYIIGVAIPYASVSQKRKGITGWRRLLRITTRGLTLFALGCLIDSSFAWKPVLDMNVLQLIGLAYLSGSLLYELPVYWRLGAAGALLIGHWALIKFTPIPGIGEPIFSEHVNIIAYINKTYLGPHFSGLISVIPTTAMILLGSATGDLLRNESCTKEYRATRLLILGLILVAIGFLWNLNLPYNKVLWTAPYIVVCAGWAMLVFGLMYFAIDIKGHRAWAFPFVVFGTNAIFAYVTPILVKAYILQPWHIHMQDGSKLSLQDALLHYSKAHAGPIGGGWLYTFGYILFWWLILLWLYRRKVFLHV